MPKCCICGKEAEYLHHGLWWCEDHHSYVKEKPEPSGKKKEGLREGRMRPSENLGLEWI